MYICMYCTSTSTTSRGDARLSIFFAPHLAPLARTYSAHRPSRNYGESAMKSIGYPKTLPQAPQRRRCIESAWKFEHKLFIRGCSSFTLRFWASRILSSLELSARLCTLLNYGELGSRCSISAGKSIPLSNFPERPSFRPIIFICASILFYI